MAGASAIVPKAALAVPRTTGSAAAPSPTQMAQLRRAAQDFESVFLGHMLKTMRSTSVSTPGMAGGTGGRMYRDLLDDELAKSISRGGGLGLADVLVRDLVRSLPREKKASSPPADGPIPESERHGSLETEPR